MGQGRKWEAEEKHKDGVRSREVLKGGGKETTGRGGRRGGDGKGRETRRRDIWKGGLGALWEREGNVGSGGKWIGREKERERRWGWVGSMACNNRTAVLNLRSLQPLLLLVLCNSAFVE